MAESPKEAAHHVVDEVKSLEHEAEEGATARTPLIVLSGITLVVAGILALLMVIAFTAYYLSN